MTSSMTLRAVVRLASIVAGTIFGIILCSAAALADGPITTTTAPQSAALTAGVQAQTSPAAAVSGAVSAQTTGAVSAQTTGAVSAQVQAQTAASSQTGTRGVSVQAQVSVQAPSLPSPQAPAQSGPPAASITGQAGTQSSGAVASVSAGSPPAAAPAAASQSPATVSGGGQAAASAASAASAAPTIHVQAQGAGQRINNTTSVPAMAGATNCTYGGVATSGAACGSGGSATAVAFAPTTAWAAAAPSSSTQARVLGIHVQNTIAAPVRAAAATCPLVGVGVHGYGCGNSGRAGAVAFAPTRLHGSSAPTASTAVRGAGMHVQNGTGAPVGAAVRSCPVVGLAVHGYGCSGRTGSAAGVIYAPTRAGAQGTPATSTHAAVAGQHLNNGTEAPAGVTVGTCPLIGIGVHGYGCDQPGSATGVVFAPTQAQGGAAPATATQAQVLGQSVTNQSAAPASGTFQSCPLVGFGIRGYGCGQPGSALGVISAPSKAETNAAPATTTQATLLGQPVNNNTAAPAGGSLQTCPVVGIAVHGYGCGNPGSGLGVIFAPTTVQGTATPSSATVGSVLGQPVANTTSAPAAAELSTCPLIGIGVHGYGCGAPGSATGVVSAPTSATIGSQPAANTQTPIDNSTETTPTNAGLSLCPVAGINVTGYGCGEPGNGTPPSGSQPGDGPNGGNPGGGTTTSAPGQPAHSPNLGQHIRNPNPDQNVHSPTPGRTPGHGKLGVTSNPNTPGGTPRSNPPAATPNVINPGHTPLPSTSTGPNPSVPAVGSTPSSTSTGLVIVPVSNSPGGTSNRTRSGTSSHGSTSFKPGGNLPGNSARNGAPPAGGRTPGGSHVPNGYPSAPPADVPAIPATFTIPRQPNAGTPSGSAIDAAGIGTSRAATTGFAGGSLATLPRTGGADGGSGNDPVRLPIGLLLLAWLLLGAGALTRRTCSAMR